MSESVEEGKHRGGHVVRIEESKAGTSAGSGSGEVPHGLPCDGARSVRLADVQGVGCQVGDEASSECVLFKGVEGHGVLQLLGYC